MDLLHKFSFLSKKGLDNRSICEYDTSHKAKALWRIFSEVPFFVLKNTFCRTKRFVRQNTEMYNAYYDTHTQVPLITLPSCVAYSKDLNAVAVPTDYRVYDWSWNA